MKLVFMDAGDLRNPEGRPSLGAERLTPASPAEGLPAGARPIHVERGAEGYTLWGQAPAEGSGGYLFRCASSDGITWGDAENVLAFEGTQWLTMAGIARSGLNGCYLLLKARRSADQSGHEVHAFLSGDGREWVKTRERPAYCDHDAFSLLWNDRAARFVAYQTTHQAWRKKYEDNMGAGPRRVLTLRTSPDGYIWQPELDIHPGGPMMDPGRIFSPDADDPEEMEFYHLKAFGWEGRFAGVMLNYAPSLQAVNPHAPGSKHGPFLSCEWWVSRDGFAWQRPHRGATAAGEYAPFMGPAPYITGERLRFLSGGEAFEAEAGRIFYAGSLANSAFSTQRFTASGGDIFADLRSGFERGVEKGPLSIQSYVMAEVLDDRDAPVPGFGRENCARAGYVDDRALKLGWTGTDMRCLAGRTVSVRLYVRDMRVYSVYGAS
jgi:hypothetical protein